MRRVAVTFLGLVLWAMARLAADSLGLSKWSVVPLLLIAGLMLQLQYARQVNMHMNRIGMPESMRSRLRNDRGFGLWIVGLGIAARSFLLAGTATPLLAAAGYFMRHKG